ncbi:MAG: bacillithiol biosynthesis deacetylase BshB1 [Nitrospinota bacterium]
MVDILAVGVHPDDIELGAGGAVAELIRSGKSVALLDLTNGEPTPHGSPEIRKKETQKANEILNVKKRIQLDFKNREVFDSQNGRRKIAEQYRLLRPKLILLPYWEDAHPDHVQASEMAQAARFIAKYTKTDMEGEPFFPPRLLFYLCVHLRKMVKPSLIFDISGTIDQKLEALRAYQSQFFSGDGVRGAEFIEKIKTQAAWYGSLIGAGYGEPFISREEIGIRSFDAIMP